MSTASKTLFILAFLVLVFASPAWASCAFSLPMLQGGDTGLPAGVIASSAPEVNGFFWELGFGDPADGAGNDGNSLITGFPAFMHPDPLLRWIKGSSRNWEVDYDWFSPGVDDCISGGSPAVASTVLVFYILDSFGDYAIAALQGTSVPFAHYNLDLLVSGLGLNFNDVFMAKRELRPHVRFASNVSDICTRGEVASPLNLYFDAGGPYEGILDLTGLTLTNGGSPEDCDPAIGCLLDCMVRDASLCWEGEVQVVASQTEGTSNCAGGSLDGFPCGPVADPNGFCEMFGGTCPPPPPIIVPFGPPIPGGCLFIGGPTVDDHAIARAIKNRGFTIFRWEATQFAVSHFHLYDVTRGERRINHDAIGRQGNNDGSVASYEFVAAGTDIRGGKRFELELVRTDGQKLRFAVE